MKKIFVIFLIISMLTVTVSCGDDAESILEKDREYNVLFVGDRYTYYNNFPDLFYEISSGAGYNFVVSVAVGDVDSLADFSDIFTTAGKKFDSKIDADTDFMVVQESYTAAYDYDVFSENILMLNDTVGFASASPKCYITQLWGKNFDVINDNTNKISETYDYKLSPVGSVFNKITEDNPDFKLLNDDGTPTLEGSYTMALCYFCVITGTRATGDLYNPAIDVAKIEIIKDTVNSIVFK